MTPRIDRNGPCSRDLTHILRPGTTSPFLVWPRRGQPVIVEPHRVTRISDRNKHTKGKQSREAVKRLGEAVSRWGQDATVYEYRLTSPAELALNVLIDGQNAVMWETIAAVTVDAFVKLEQGARAHAAFVSRDLLSAADFPPGWQLWRRPEPLDLYTIDAGTLYEFFYYSGKPVLAGAERPGRSKLRPPYLPTSPAVTIRQQFAVRLLAAQVHTEAAQGMQRLTTERRKLPACAGWMTDSRGRVKGQLAKPKGRKSRRSHPYYVLGHSEAVLSPHSDYPTALELAHDLALDDLGQW